MIFALVAGVAGPVHGQGETLADIRQDLSVLTVELAKLKRELSTTGGASVQVSGDVLQRVNAIEAELQRVTAKAEQLEFRVGQVARDGANRVGDLQFRICELEPGCDIGALPTVDPLGGEVAPAPAVPVAAAPATDALPFEGELAVSEEADFRAAQEALDAGDFDFAAQLFEDFREIYPQGPLEAAALLGEGRARDGQGDTRAAARLYLDVYSGFPDARVAPEALWRLGVKLAELDSTPEACVTLGEVAMRFPASEFVSAAVQSMAEIGCS